MLDQALPPTWWSTALSVVLALLLIGVNAFFVAAEYAIVRVRRTRLEELAGQGVSAARVSIVCVDQLDASIATTQVAITMASLGVGWFGESGFAHLLSLLVPAAFSSVAPLHLLSSALAFVAVTMMHVVLGEMVPKNMAIDRAERIILVIARPLQVCGAILRPMVWAFTRLASTVTRMLGHRGEGAPPLSEDELKLVLKESHAGGVITKSEADIIHRAFEFADKMASDLMIAAEDVQYLSMARTPEENIAVASRSQHTRFPLCTGELDSVFGVVNMKDAWPLLAGHPTNEAFREVSRPVTWIDPEMAQDEILQALRQRRAHMACIRNPGTKKVLGIVTLEEVLDALLGDLRENEPHRDPA